MPLLLDPCSTLLGSQYYAIVKELALKNVIVIGLVLQVSLEQESFLLPVWSSFSIPRKEVIQPQVPLRLPCYDFTPITPHTLGAYLPIRG